MKAKPSMSRTACRYAAKAQGGDTRSRRIEAHRETILALHGASREITLDELRRELGQAGVRVAILTLHRFFARHGTTRKKGRPRGRAGRRGRSEPASGMVRRPARPRPCAAGVHRRDLDGDQHDAQPRPLPARRAEEAAQPAASSIVIRSNSAIGCGRNVRGDQRSRKKGSIGYSAVRLFAGVAIMLHPKRRR